MARRSRLPRKPTALPLGQSLPFTPRNALGRFLSPANPIAKYFYGVESALQKLKRSKRARLNIQDAYHLSAAIRRHQFGPEEWAPEFRWKRGDFKRANAWYAGQAKKAKRDLPARFRKLVREWKKISIDMQGKRALVYRPKTTAEPIRKFRSTQSLTNFLALPHYRDARNRLRGTFGIAAISSKTRRITRMLYEVKAK